MHSRPRWQSSPPARRASTRCLRGRISSRFDLEGFLAKHGVRFRGAQSYQGGRKRSWRNVRGTRHTCARCGCFESADGRLGFRCLHNSCRHLGWRDFRKFFEPDYGQADREWVPESGTQERGGRPADSNGAPVAVPWPAPIGVEGHYGLAGEFVRLVEPHTEGDPNWLLVLFLVYAATSLVAMLSSGRAGDKHHTNLFAVGVGPPQPGGKAARRVRWRCSFVVWTRPGSSRTSPDWRAAKG